MTSRDLTEEIINTLIVSVVRLLRGSAQWVHHQGFTGSHWGDCPELLSHQSGQTADISGNLFTPHSFYDGLNQRLKRNTFPFLSTKKWLPLPLSFS